MRQHPPGAPAARRSPGATAARRPGGRNQTALTTGAKTIATAAAARDHWRCCCQCAASSPISPDYHPYRRSGAPQTTRTSSHACTGVRQ
eukprot:scaffold121313_cov63-Phaeocystis_antarctica.AAC.1